MDAFPGPLRLAFRKQSPSGRSAARSAKSRRTHTRSAAPFRCRHTPFPYRVVSRTEECPMSRRSRVLSVSLSTSLALALLSACSTQGGDDRGPDTRQPGVATGTVIGGTPKRGGTLTVLSNQDFAHLDPARNWVMPTMDFGTLADLPHPHDLPGPRRGSGAARSSPTWRPTSAEPPTAAAPGPSP